MILPPAYPQDTSFEVKQYLLLECFTTRSPYEQRERASRREMSRDPDRVRDSDRVRLRVRKLLEVFLLDLRERNESM